MTKNQPVIVSAARTPVGSFGGALQEVKVVNLGSEVLRELLARLDAKPTVRERVKRTRPDTLQSQQKSEVEDRYMDWSSGSRELPIDEVIFGHVLQGGQGQNTARQASIRAGIPQEINAFTVNKVCASGMKAVALAAQAIRAGEAQAILAGGMENMSRAPYLLPDLRWGQRMFDTQARDLMVFDGLYEIFYDYHMGITAENIADKYGISRRAQDELGAQSNHRALKAQESGAFDAEIVPIEISDEEVFSEDEPPMETSVEKMSKLPTVFKEDGTVTAGNASGIADGAAGLFITSEEYARTHDLKIRARINGSTSGGVDPKYMGLGPIPAVRQLTDQLSCSVQDFDLVELNEAFASQTIACAKELELDHEKTNIYGSGISLGHPIGCTGARILVTLLHGMEQRENKLGLATLCIGGGQGMAMALER